MKRTLALFLAMLMLATTACSSKDTSDKGNAETTGAISATANTTAAETELPPSLPQVYDLEGYEFRYIKQDSGAVTWSRAIISVSAEETADIMNDTIYKRNQAATSQYNFTITETIVPKDPRDTLVQMVQGDYDEYDLGLVRLDTNSNLVDGTYVNFYEVPNMDLERAYYDQGLIRDITFNDTLYFMTGDMLISDNDSLMVTLFNRPLAEDFKITGLYDLARSGKWTLDKMYEYSKAVADDLDGDGVIEPTDRVGLLYANNSAGAPYFAASETYLFTKDGDELNFTGDRERAYTVFETVQKQLSDKSLSTDWATFGKEAVVNIQNMVSGKNVLFMNCVISLMAQELRDVDVDFGALPMPKLDESQKQYSTMVNVATPYMAIPATTRNLDKVGFIIEALSAASGSIDDVYFDICLEAKYSRDEESPEMLRLARENIVYDPGFIYNWGTLGTKIWQGTINSTTGYASLIAESEEMAIKEMESLQEAIFERSE